VKPPARERIKAVLVISLKLIVAVLVFSVLAGWVHIDWIDWSIFFWLLLIPPLLFGLWLTAIVCVLVYAFIRWVVGKKWREDSDQKQREQGHQRYARYRPVQGRRYERSGPAQDRRYEPSIDYDKYIDSEDWRDTAEDAKQRAGYRCQLCNTSYKPLEVHHLTYVRLGEELPSDLLVVCRDCHRKLHDKSAKRTRRTRDEQ